MSKTSQTKSARMSFADVLLDVPEHWRDIGDTLPSGTPPTLATEDGTGALQFSIGLYRDGPLPDMNIKSLEQMLYHFEDAQGFERSEKAMEWKTSAVFGIACDYYVDAGFIRVWYCSDGANVAFITFNTDPLTTKERRHELEEADGIARSLKF